MTAAKDRRFWLTIRNPQTEEDVRAEAQRRGVSLADVVNDRLEHCAAREAALREEIERWRQTVKEMHAAVLGSPAPSTPKPAGGSPPPALDEGLW